MSVERELTTQSVRLSTVDADLRWGLKAYGLYKWHIKLSDSFVHRHPRWPTVAGFLLFLLQSSFHLKLLSFYYGFHHQASLWHRFVHSAGKVANTAVLPKVPLVLPCLVSAFQGTSWIFSIRAGHHHLFLLPFNTSLCFVRYTWSSMMTQGLFSKGKWQVHFPSVSLTQNSLEHL